MTALLAAAVRIKNLAGGDADFAGNAEFIHRGGQRGGGAQCTHGVVFTRRHGQAEPAQQRNALVVRGEPREYAAVTLVRALRALDRSLQGRQRASIAAIHAGQSDEQCGDVAEFAEPGTAAHAQALKKRLREITFEQARRITRRRRTERQGRQSQRRVYGFNAAAARPRLTPGAVGMNIPPQRRADHDFAGTRLVILRGRLRQRAARRQAVPFVVNPAHREMREPSAGQRNTLLQRCAGLRHYIRQRALQRQPALHRDHSRVSRRGGGRLPDHQHGVADKINHIAAVRQRDIRHTAKILVQQNRKPFGADRAGLCVALGKAAKADDIEHQHHAVEITRGRGHARFGRHGVREPGQHVARHVALQCWCCWHALQPTLL